MMRIIKEDFPNYRVHYQDYEFDVVWDAKLDSAYPTELDKVLWNCNLSLYDFFDKIETALDQWRLENDK